MTTASLKVKVVPVGNKQIGMKWCLGGGGVVPRALHVGRLNDNATDWYYRSDHFESWSEHWMSLDLSSLQPDSKVIRPVGHHFSSLSFNYVHSTHNLNCDCVS